METIAAIATGHGVVSGVGVIRVSGDDAIAVSERVLRAYREPSRHIRLRDTAQRTMTRCALLDCGGAVIDDILAVVFPAPHSYTGEDVVELHCHGSPVVLEEAVKALCAAGARQALPGEYTKRAFLNGRMDLMQAEAVADLIDAETAAQARNAAGQLGGALTRTVGHVYDALMGVTAQFYAVVDYPDEDIEPVQRAELERTLEESAQRLKALLSTAARGMILKHGAATALVGRPNVGKSSLMNALLGYDRAIVTEIAGTTRDTVEEKVVCGGVTLRLTDTAGIRETEDTVERIGVERSKSAMYAADLVFALIDASVPVGDEDSAIIQEASQNENWFLILTKSDLPCAADPGALSWSHPPRAVLRISSVTGAGLEELERAVEDVYPQYAPGALVTNGRQTEALRRAADGVCAALEALRGGMTPDIVLIGAEDALSALGELNGKTVRDDLTATIFSRFCVGK